MRICGRCIKLFLMDNEVNGRIKYTLDNWSGVIYKIPRIMLEKSKDIEHLYQAGVYLLFGYSDEAQRPIVYIGQASLRKNGNATLGRLKEHECNSDEDYWTEAMVFTKADNSFGPTEISYLENKFWKLAKNINRYEVKNSNEPNIGNLTEEKICEMERFIEQAKVVLGAIGYKVFEPVIERKIEVDSVIKEEPILCFKGKGLNAKGKRVADGFVVLSGSEIYDKLTKSCPKSTRKMREIYKDNINSNGILTIDVHFNSPSAAAGFVGGASLNGYESWRDQKTGKMLGEIEER